MALVEQERRVGRNGPANNQQRRVTRPPVVSLLVGMLACIGMLATFWMVFFYAPLDAVQGIPQKIFYIHVPSAWIGMLAFVVLTIAGIVYLFKADERWDWVARASAEVGLIFLTVALVSGSIWGKITWGTWWSWDAKLTAVLILWFMFVAYLMLRSYMGRTEASARSAAVLGIIGCIDVPIIYEATNWWRTLHPAAQIGTPDGGLPPEAVWTFLVALVAFTLLYSFLLVQVYQLQRLQTLAQRLRSNIE
jgi:heme exporter protein C